MDEYTAREMTLRREESERVRYRNYYRIEIDDLTPYHLTMNSELWSGEQLAAIVDLALSYLNKK
jgi:cytidylate kinase